MHRKSDKQQEMVEDNKCKAAKKDPSFRPIPSFTLVCSYWLEKKTHVHPVYPANCSDDLAFIDENNCTELLWPKVKAAIPLVS